MKQKKTSVNWESVADNLSQQVAIYAKDQAILVGRLQVESQENAYLVEQNKKLAKENNEYKRKSKLERINKDTPKDEKEE